MNNNNEISFEAAFAELELIVSKLESGELSLETSLAYFERGRALSNHCQMLLDKAELRVSQLQEDGSMTSLD